MDGCRSDILTSLAHATEEQIVVAIETETKYLEVTKSVLNVLYNIVSIGSIPISGATKSYLDNNSDLVLDLVSKSKPLWWKRQQLKRNPALAKIVAKTCPTAAL